MLKRSVTIGELKQAFAGKPDNTPFVLYDACLDMYCTVERVRAARVIQDANGFLINAPEAVPMGNTVVSATISS